MILFGRFIKLGLIHMVVFVAFVYSGCVAMERQNNENISDLPTKSYVEEMLCKIKKGVVNFDRKKFNKDLALKVKQIFESEQCNDLLLRFCAYGCPILMFIVTIVLPIIYATATSRGRKEVEAIKQFFIDELGQEIKELFGF